MAGDWLKMRTQLPTERATLIICERTSLDEFAVVGRLHAVWAWAGEHTVTGDVTDVTLKTIDRVTRCDGFGAAMVAAKWLEELPGGGVRFPRWKKHNAKAAKARSLAAQRQANWRAKCNASERDGKRDASVTSNAPREEKRREEKKEKKEKNTNPLPPFPTELDNDAFKTAWSSWLQHRKEKRDNVTPTSAGRSFKTLAKIGSERAIAAIEVSIEKGWKGIFEANGSSHESGQRVGRLSRVEAPRGKYDDLEIIVCGEDVPAQAG